MKPSRLALLGAALAAPATAQSVQFSAVAQSEIGYGSNPFLVPGLTEGSIFASASIQPSLIYQTARSMTTLLGQYSRETYIHKFGYTDSGNIGLTRTDQLTQFLTTTLTANFTTTNKDTISDPTLPVTDPLDIGRRTKTLTGGYQLQWQASARDQITYGAQVSHLSYGSAQNGSLGGIPSSYTQYGLNGGYSHALDARTSVGAQVSFSSVRSKIYPDSRTIQPALTAKRQLTAVWEVDGHVGVVFSHIDGPFAKSTKSLGLGLNLCGTYPRTHLCFKVTRDTAPSGFGPLRTATSAEAELTHDLSEHSHLSFSAQYLQDSSGSFALTGSAVPRNTKALYASTSYDRDLTQRISAGFGGQYRLRMLTGYRDARGYEATVHVKAKLGRM